MSTLLLRIAAPMQAWGIDARFERRGTERTPSKSGVIGMLAAALGMRRDEDISALSALRFGVRTDRDGRLLRDFHTARHPTDSKRAYVTYRYYLCDAVFLVGIEGDADMLSQLEDALRKPAYPLFLGRRSCPPSGKLVLGVREKTLTDALKSEPPLVENIASARITVDAADVGGIMQRDLPISFNQEKRQFGFRGVMEMKTYFAAAPVPTLHDPMQDLEE